MVVDVAVDSWRGRRSWSRPRVGLGLVISGVLSVVLAGQVYGGVHTAASTINVRPGDTLWSIASAQYPNEDPRNAIDQISALNHLDGQTIEPGEQLQLPAQ